MIRASSGFRPVLVFDHAVPQTESASCIFDLSFAALGLAGLEFEVSAPPDAARNNGPIPFVRQSAVNCNGGRLQIAHCRFHTLPGQPLQVAVRAGTSRRIGIRDSEFFGGSAVGWGCPADGTLTVSNCISVGPSAISLRRIPETQSSVEVFGSTFINQHLLTVVVTPRVFDPKPDSLRVRVDRSLIDSADSLLCLRAVGGGLRNPGRALRPLELKNLPISGLVSWQGLGNIYDMGPSYLAYGFDGNLEFEPPTTVDEWQLLWLEAETDARTGRIRCGQIESWHPDLLKLKSGLDLFLERFENGRRILPGTLPGALVTRTGPSEHYEDWLGTRNEIRWRRELMDPVLAIQDRP